MQKGLFVSAVNLFMLYVDYTQIHVGYAG